MAKLKLDLHEIYNRGGQIDAELNRIVQEALSKKIALVEIIPGKGSGQLNFDQPFCAAQRRNVDVVVRWHTDTALLMSGLL